MFTLKIQLTFTNTLLGTLPNNPNILRDHIDQDEFDDGTKLKREMAAVEGLEEVLDRGTTVFPRMEDGVTPFIYDYQMKGFFKEKMSFLRKIPGTHSSKVKAFKKEIDGLLFFEDRENPINVNGEMGIMERPLRASTPQGERVSIARSETIPAGSTVQFTIRCMLDSYLPIVKECLAYGAFHGTGQWRNSGKGTFTYKILDETIIPFGDGGAVEESGEAAPAPKKRGRKKKTEEAAATE